MDLHGKRVVVLGLGISGMESAQLLQDHGAAVTVRDSAGDHSALTPRAEILRRHGIEVELGDAISSGTFFDFAVLSPGINPDVPLVRALKESAVPLMGELELASRYCACPIIAITGTNGKTTTTELINAILAADGKRTRVAGNIGTAFSAAVRESAQLDVMVLEVSSFQLEEISEFRPHISVYLNLTPDHLDRYPSMADYQKAKENIFRNQTAEDFAVVNATLQLPSLTATRVTFSPRDRDADYHLEEGWLVARGERVLEQAQTRLIGPHNAENMLAALAVADLYDVPRDVIRAALIAYRPLPHRLEYIGQLDGVSYLNDSKATNIDALEKALLAMTGPVILLAGGKDKGLDFAALTPLVQEKARAVILIGQMADKLTTLWGASVACHRANDLADAVAQCRQLAQDGDTVLFSPGCSSFDMFRDFEDRGNQFRELARQMGVTTENH